MLLPRLLLCALALALPAVPSLVLAEQDPPVALANYQVGSKLQAKHDCTVKGFAIKKDATLTVSAVNKNDKNAIESLDLTFQGMNIDGVDLATVQANFRQL